LKTIVLTGGTGFVGGHLLENILLSCKLFVICITRNPKSPDLRKHQNLKWMSWQDYLDMQGDNDLHIYAVIHLATSYGRDDDNMTEAVFSNYQLPAKLFEKSILFGASKILIADSFYGKTQFDYSHLKHYTDSKKKLVRWCISRSKLCNVKFINMRFEHVIGPYDRSDKFVPYIIKKLKTFDFPIKLTSCNQRRDFIYVNDVVNAILVLLNEQKNFTGFKEFELGNGFSIPIRSFIELLSEVYCTDLSVFKFGSIDNRPNEIMDSYADIEPLLNLGWKPKWDLKDALNDLRAKEKYQIK